MADISLQVADGVHGLVNREWSTQRQAPLAPVPLTLLGLNDQPLTLRATDAWGNPTDWTASVKASSDGSAKAEFNGDFGVYRIEAVNEAGAVLAHTHLGIIPPFHPGVRKDSFFASNTSEVRTGKDLDLIEAIGMKVQRAHVQKMTPKSFQEQQRRNTWILPIVGYADPTPRTALAIKLKQWGPPADFEAFTDFWESHMKKFPEIETWEFWNEPWIFGWTWADTPAEYRRLQRMWSEMALKSNSKLNIIAGNSWMFVQDHMEQHPDSWKNLISATSHHPYSGAADLTWRAGDSQRSIDAGFLINQRMGLERYYITEGGTNLGTTDHGGSVAVYKTPANIVNARKIVQLYVTTALAGAFQGNAQWGLGYGPAWTHSNASFAFMTHMLEDRPIVADLWPKQSLIRCAVFANPRHIDDAVKKLPRAQELGVRWKVPVPAERSNDPTKVAVLWAWTGSNASTIDTNGTLTLNAPEDVQAYDLFGREIPRQANGSLIIPFNENPVYLTTDKLNISQFHQLIDSATLNKLTPVNIYAMPLGQPADQAQPLRIRLDNQMNEIVAGTLSLAIPGHDLVSVPYQASPGALLDLTIPWPGTALSNDNRYGIALQAKVNSSSGRDLGAVSHSQVIQVARFIKKTIQIDGQLNDWQGITPVLLTGPAQVDLTRYLLDPHLEKPTLEGADKNPVRVFTAYDDNYLYVAIEGQGNKTQVGTPRFEDLPYKQGEPGGLQFVQYVADTVQLAFGFRDRVPGHGRQMDDPWAWKGHFYDTDYLYVAHATVDSGDQLIRQWGPETDRRTAYQTDPLPHVKPVPEAKIMIKDSIWEIAIPRKELAMFDPGKDSFRFGFLVGGNRNWSDTAGVFDYWRGSGSFNPSWEFRTAAQTTFGIEK